MQLALVTGATGLVGSHLTKALLNRGYRVKALRRETADTRLFDKVCGEAANNHTGNFEWVEGDILDIDTLKTAMRSIEQVFHCAGMVSFQPGAADRLLEVNGQGTANMVNVALSEKVAHFVHVSSVAALGRVADDAHIDEQTLWQVSPRNSMYAISKYAAEREVWRAMAEGLPAAIVNPSVILGRGDWRSDSSMVFGQVWRGLKFYTDGITGFVDVEDVVKAMVLLADRKITDQRFVVSGENLPFRTVFDHIADGLGKPRATIHAGKTLSGFAWRMERLRTLFSGGKPVITKETALSAVSRYFYSSEKIIKATGMQFTPVLQCVSNTCKSFMEEKKA